MDSKIVLFIICKQIKHYNAFNYMYYLYILIIHSVDIQLPDHLSYFPSQ